MHLLKLFCLGQSLQDSQLDQVYRFPAKSKGNKGTIPVSRQNPRSPEPKAPPQHKPGSLVISLTGKRKQETETKQWRSARKWEQLTSATSWIS